jgi:hypothetical protein
MHTFMSLGVVRDYAERLFACSPYTYRFFPRILRIWLKLSAHSETILSTQTTLHPQYSPYTLKYFPHIFRIRLDTFPAFFIGAKILSTYPLNTQKEVRLRREKFSHSEESPNFIAKKYEKPNSADKFGHIMIDFRF